MRVYRVKPVGRERPSCLRTGAIRDARDRGRVHSARGKALVRTAAAGRSRFGRSHKFSAGEADDRAIAEGGVGLPLAVRGDPINCV
jgi:hypothetical protein